MSFAFYIWSSLSSSVDNPPLSREVKLFFELDFLIFYKDFFEPLDLNDLLDLLEPIDLIEFLKTGFTFYLLLLGSEIMFYTFIFFSLLFPILNWLLIGFYSIVYLLKVGFDFISFFVLIWRGLSILTYLFNCILAYISLSSPLSYSAD